MPETVKILQNLLDYCTVKNKVIAKNIANIGTENYKREDVTFKDILNDNVNSLLKTSNNKHIAGLNVESSNHPQFEFTENQSEEMDSGVNNVNIEKEMTDLAENTLRYQFATKKVSEYYKVIQNVLSEASKS
jgi:flagellar basal-body rod protein FlgB